MGRFFLLFSSAYQDMWWFKYVLVLFQVLGLLFVKRFFVNAIAL